jgi:hypothetical protein
MHGYIQSVVNQAISNLVITVLLAFVIGYFCKNKYDKFTEFVANLDRRNKDNMNIVYAHDNRLNNIEREFRIFENRIEKIEREFDDESISGDESIYTEDTKSGKSDKSGKEDFDEVK